MTTFFIYFCRVKKMIDIFVELGERLAGRGICCPMEQAYSDNNWFSHNEIERAIEAIRTTMLSRDNLSKWLADYPNLPTQRPEKVLIVMAGNIPLVGFFDLLCTLFAGDIAVVKPSHKDRVLMLWVISLLKEIEPSTPIFIYNEGESIDRVIATGGEAAMLHFNTKYSGTPTLLRGSRHSVAVIADNAPTELLEDIYSYSGLGCRNVSLIFTPRGYDLAELPTPNIEDLNPKYRNNYLQNRALLAISGAEFFDSGTCCMVHQECFPTRISTISIVEYGDISEVKRWLESHNTELQCIVAEQSTLNHPRRVDFGEAQRPTLYDYADSVDTMKFLTL